jgi:hypothetical protein
MNKRAKRVIWQALWEFGRTLGMGKINNLYWWNYAERSKPRNNDDKGKYNTKRNDIPNSILNMSQEDALVMMAKILLDVKVK